MFLGGFIELGLLGSSDSILVLSASSNSLLHCFNSLELILWTYIVADANVHRLRPFQYVKREH